jgi:hypothetical protein
MALDSFIRRLLRAEPDAVTPVMAFMSYNPAIGRVLEGGGVKKFARVAAPLVRGLPNVRSRRHFDRLHSRSVRRILRTFRTSRKRKLSYGQAAKPINVFLKVYVDWAARPSPQVWERLLPLLHVPLDSVLMDKIREKDSAWYQREIWPHVKGQAFPHSLSPSGSEGVLEVARLLSGAVAEEAAPVRCRVGTISRERPLTY